MRKQQIILRLKEHSNGKAIKLDDMTLEESIDFKDLLETFIKLAQSYDNSKSETRIKLVKSSAALQWETSAETMEQIEYDMNEVFEGESYNNQIVTFYRHIQNFLRSNDYRLDFNIVKSENDTRSILPQFRQERTFHAKRGARVRRISELEFIHGELLDLGGTKINFHVMESGAEYAKIINCQTKEEARRVRNYVYSNVYVVARKRRGVNSIERDFIDVYSDQTQYNRYKEFYEMYQLLDGQERYNAFYELVKSHLNSSDLNVEDSLKLLRKYIRLFDNDWTEPGQLRTILTSLKAFQKHPILEGNLTSILDRLKSLTRKEKI